MFSDTLLIGVVSVVSIWYKGVKEFYSNILIELRYFLLRDSGNDLFFLKLALFIIKIVLFFYDSRWVSVECYVVIFCSSGKKLEFVAGAMFLWYAEVKGAYVSLKFVVAGATVMVCRAVKWAVVSLKLVVAGATVVVCRAVKWAVVSLKLVAGATVGVCRAVKWACCELGCRATIMVCRAGR